MTTNLDPHEFDDEVVASTSLPYCQVQNPPNLPLATIEKHQYPWGIFLPDEQAILVEFKPTDDFQPTVLTFAEGTPNQREVPGWITRKVRVAVIHRSSIEVQEKSELGWRYVGVAYDRGQPTVEGTQAFADRQRYRLRTRYLLMFLDRHNQPLHTIPLRLGLGSGSGATFGYELRNFKQELERAWFKMKGWPV